MSATGGLGLTTAQSYLKDYFLPNGFWQELTNDSQMLSDFRSMGETIGIFGETSTFVVENRRQSGVKIAHETANLPEVNPRKGVKGYVIPRQIYGRTSLDEFTIAITRNNAGAYISALSERFETLIEDFGNATQLSVMTDTYAKLALATSVKTTQTEIDVDTIWRFEPGIKVKIFANDGNGHPTGSALFTTIVSDVDHDGKKVTFEDAVTTAVGSVICFNIEDASGLDVEGIEGHFETVAKKNSLHNIDRTTAGQKFYATTQISNGASEAILDENVLRKASSRQGQLAPKKRSFTNVRIYGGVQEIDGYESTLTSQRRYPSVGNAPQYESGKAVDGLYFDNKLMHKDKYYTPNTVGLFSMGSWNMHIVEDENFMDKDGSILHRIADKPGYEGTEYMFWNISNKNPRENVNITNVEAYDPSV